MSGLSFAARERWSTTALRHPVRTLLAVYVVSRLVAFAAICASYSASAA